MQSIRDAAAAKRTPAHRMFHGCIGFVACVQVCLFPADGGVGGTVQQCGVECEVGYTQQQTQEGEGLLSCLAGSCASSTTCGE